MKNKETLEEVAKGYAEANKFLSDRPFEFNRDLVAFINGAKWQQERSYSEEEVIAFGEFIFKHSLLTHTKGVKSLFEQFKNK